MDLHHLLRDLVVIFSSGVLAVLLLRRVGLPPVVGFLAAGLLVGPHTLGLVGDVHTVELIAELGVALLLFTIGLELSLERLRRIGRLVAVGGSLQVGLTVLGGVGLALALGASWQQGVFWGCLGALSSTAIVLRELGERGELNAPHGRMVVGVLIFQDLCIVPMMLAVPLLAGEGGSVVEVLGVLGRSLAVLALVIALALRVVPWFLRRVARTRSREVFLLAVLALASAVAWATASLGLSLALGAFLAGVVVSETEYVHQALSEVTPFRDALASLFFVSVGMLLDPAVVLARPGFVVALVGLLLVGKLALATLAVLLMRFPARVAVLSGLALAQVGEFSFVLLRSGQGAGLLSPVLAGQLLAASVVTMVGAPLVLALSPRLAAGARLLRPLERLLAVRPQEEAPEAAEAPPRDHVVIAGLGLGGRTLALALEAARVPYVAVELNPETVIRERAQGRRVVYGDVTSVDVLEHQLHVPHARQVVLLLSDVAAGRRAAALIRARYPAVPVLLRVHRLEYDLDGPLDPGVQLLAEDQEAAVEVVERVLRGAGVAGSVVAGLVSAARGVRQEGGAPALPPAGVGGVLALEALTLAPGDAAVGQSLGGLGLRARSGALVVALGRGGQVRTAPEPDAALCAGDTLFLVGLREQLGAAEGVLRGPGVLDGGPGA